MSTWMERSARGLRWSDADLMGRYKAEPQPATLWRNVLAPSRAPRDAASLSVQGTARGAASDDGGAGRERREGPRVRLAVFFPIFSRAAAVHYSYHQRLQEPEGARV